MAATCKVVCCDVDKETDKAVIVQFSNGNLKNADELDFTYYKNIDDKNPRKQSRRMLVAESDRLSYVGNNFAKSNLCKYYVGVLNKETMHMDVHTAQLFNMQPVIPGETTETDTSKTNSQSFREKVDSLIEAFGTNKQKRALSSRRLNQVGSETLQQAVAKAASSVIDQKGLEALQQEVAQTESQEDVAIYLPPCHRDADKPENVYLFDDLLTPVEYGALEEAGSKIASLSPEELQKMRKEGSLCVVRQLELLPSVGEAREKGARCAYYLNMMLRLAQERHISRKFGKEDGCPRIIQNKLLDKFTVETFRNGRVQNMVSSTMRLKVAAYCMALLLHMGHMTVNLTLLYRDLGVTEAKIMDLAKLMGLTLSKSARGKADETELTDEHKHASLILPLVKYEPMIDRRKRKKMH